MSIDSSSPERTERALRAVLGAALAAVPMMGACSPGGACKNTGFTPQPFNVTFQVCAPIDFDAATLDDSSAADAGDASTVSDASAVDADVDAGMCFATCDDACATLKPDTLTGIGTCVVTDGALPAPGTTVSAQCTTILQCTGRKLEGLLPPNVEGEALGAWLARAAWLEAASVHAFRRLARELRAHGAPRELVVAARASARDEIRHARMLGALAVARGVIVPRVERRAFPVRDLESVARENATAGCVSETYGAAIAAWLADHASEPAVADAMRSIAPDELRHAALGWAVAAWAEWRLSEGGRARVRDARNREVRELLYNARSSPEEHALASALTTALWAA